MSDFSDPTSAARPQKTNPTSKQNVGRRRHDWRVGTNDGERACAKCGARLSYVYAPGRFRGQLSLTRAFCPPGSEGWLTIGRRALPQCTPAGK